MTHFAELCGCGIVLSTCRCPAINKKLTVLQTCKHDDNWAQKLEAELSEQYDIAANANIRPHGQSLDVELNGSRQLLAVEVHSLYGYIVSLKMYDETGGLIVEADLFTGVDYDIATTIDSIYRSYQ